MFFAGWAKIANNGPITLPKPTPKAKHAYKSEIVLSVVISLINDLITELFPVKSPPNNLAIKAFVYDVVKPNSNELNAIPITPIIIIVFLPTRSDNELLKYKLP